MDRPPRLETLHHKKYEKINDNSSANDLDTYNFKRRN